MCKGTVGTCTAGAGMITAEVVEVIAVEVEIGVIEETPVEGIDEY